MITLQDVKYAMIQHGNGDWFSRKNKRFFGDVSYKVLHGRATKKPYLVRSTFAWPDMFGGNKTLHYRINEIRDDNTIGSLLDQRFVDIESVKEWMKIN